MTDLTDKELKEYFEENTIEEKTKPPVAPPTHPTEHHEAPASATVKIKSENGFEWLYTMRDTKAGDLLKKMRLIEGAIMSEGYQPIASGYKKKEYTQKPENLDPNAPICPTHNRRMDWKTGVSKASGKPYAFWSCSQKLANGGWCDYKPNTNYKPDQIQ